MASRNRTAGNNYERDIAKFYRKVGFPHVVTSRSESRATDNRKIDLMNKDPFRNGEFPLAPQCKTAASNLDVVKVFKEIDSDKIKVLHYRRTKKAKTRFVSQGDFVVIDLEFYGELLKTWLNDRES